MATPLPPIDSQRRSCSSSDETPEVRAMSLNARAAAIFEGPQIARIHFRLGRLEVSPQRLRGVGKAMKKDDIHVVPGKTGKLLSAAYSPHSNTLTVSDEKLASIASRAAVLHEGVHALVDMYKCKEVTVLNDEAAAYLAEAIYLRASHRWVQAGAEEMAIYNAADTIAKAHDLYNRRGVRLSLEDVADLRAAIHKHSAYSGIGAKQKTSGHGLHKH
jgi:hypothetical protein